MGRGVRESGAYVRTWGSEGSYPGSVEGRAVV